MDLTANAEPAAGLTPPPVGDHERALRIERVLDLGRIAGELDPFEFADQLYKRDRQQRVITIRLHPAMHVALKNQAAEFYDERRDRRWSMQRLALRRLFPDEATLREAAQICVGIWELCDPTRPAA